MIRKMRFFVFGSELSTLLLLGICCAGCTVDTSIDSSALLTCENQGECPGGWTCDLDALMCRSPEYTDSETETSSDAGDAGDADDADDADTETQSTDTDSDTSVYRYEDKKTVCEAVWTKAQDCDTELKAALGEEAASIFSLPKDSFVEDMCIPQMLNDTTDEKLDESLNQIDLLTLASCDIFVSTIAEL